MPIRWLFALTVLLGAVPGAAGAKELQVIGRAAVAIGASTAADVKAAATRQARASALAAAVDKVLGPSASRDPKVAGKLGEALDQIQEGQFVDTRSSAAAGTYEMTVTLVVDDKEFRTLLSDLGIAVNTAAVRGFSILAVMDEFLTTPRDLKAPLEELEIFRSEVGQSAHDRSKASASSSASSASASASQTQVDATTASSTRVAGAYDTGLDARGQGGAVTGHDRGSMSAAASERASLKGSDARSSARSASASQASRSANDVASEQHDNQFHMKLVKYQPQGGSPEKTSQTYNALMGQLQDYDLRVLDNDVFRSKHLKDKPLTIQELQGGAELARYVAFAKAEANADFFLVGTTIVVDAGKNENTGDLECTGLVSLKTFSTVDGESIASETFSEASSGRNINDCAANLARKLAAIGGPVIGAKVQDYWKRRATYGREYLVTLLGTSLPLMVKSAFTKGVKAVPGVEGDTQRAASATRLQVVVTYKGSDPLDQAVASSLSANPAFEQLDSRTDGNQVTLCLGPCDEVEKAVLAREGKK
ncbi:MAG: hypothetical protein IPQ24_10040 [Anaeromyxobacter sp.]|nr:hypothetical protein [Anaeromyxobacter sp.]